MIPEHARSLPKRVRLAWLVVDIIALLLVFVTGLIVNLIFKLDWYSPVAIGVNGLFGIVMLVIISDAVLIPYHYRFYKYVVNESAVSIYKGFIWRRSKTIPLNRIQNVDTRQGPIFGFFHLQNLAIVTAAHAFKIEGINEEVAHYLRDQLIAAARQAREVDTDD